MPRDRAKVEASLQEKGFKEEAGDHRFFVFYSRDGLKTPVYTKTSGSPKYKSLDDSLLGSMAKQCRVSKAEFLSVIDCPLSYGSYEALLKKKDAILRTSTT